MVDSLEEAETARLRAALPLRLVQALRQSGLTRRALADITGVHLNTVHAYASGLRLPRTSQLSLLARALRVPLDWLLALEDSPELSMELGQTELEILEYIHLENARGHSPPIVEISHAFDQEPYWASPYVRKMQRFGLLAPQPGTRVTKAGLGKIPPNSKQRAAQRRARRRPVV